MKLTSLPIAFGILLFMFTPPGCTSSCGDHCPVTTVWIGTPDNGPLLLSGITLSGPACPAPGNVRCNGNYYARCTEFTITARAAGRCDVEVDFGDGRSSEIVHLAFGPAQSGGGGCCQGYPVIGPWLYAVPDAPDGGDIYSTSDGGVMDYDAISIVPNASADGTTY
jgi:hypothetical protein